MLVVKLFCQRIDKREKVHSREFTRHCNNNHLPKP